jgi:flagellar biosynthesis chaperone FliJ
MAGILSALKLKERDHREFLLALDRAENQLIDELATVRFNRERNT